MTALRLFSWRRLRTRLAHSKSYSHSRGSRRCQAYSKRRTTVTPTSFMRAPSSAHWSSGQSSGYQEAPRGSSEGGGWSDMRCELLGGRADDPVEVLRAVEDAHDVNIRLGMDVD